MNKVILTHDRIFMSVVGPSGSGKTELIFKMLKGATFYPTFDKIYYFYQEYQSSFAKVQKELKGITFIKYTGFEITKSLKDCLLIYDDSCEKIFNDCKSLSRLQHQVVTADSMLFTSSTICFTKVNGLEQ